MNKKLNKVTSGNVIKVGEKWYYAIPFVLIWLAVIALIVMALI